MNYLFIIVIAVAICIIFLYNLLKGAISIEEEEDLFDIEKEAPNNEPEKVDEISKEEIKVTDAVKEVSPKKKYYKRRKKKPSTNTQLEKRPVGRPRKNTE
jgi:hypothetical protein